MIYDESLDLGRCRKCLVSIGVIDDMVVAKMSFLQTLYRLTLQYIYGTPYTYLSPHIQCKP